MTDYTERDGAALQYVQDGGTDGWGDAWNAAWDAATEHALAIALNTFDIWINGYQGEGTMRPIEDCLAEDVRSGVIEPNPYKH